MTRTLIEAGLIDDSYFSDKARGRGRLAHYVAEKILTNQANGPIDAAVLPYMLGLRKFLDRYAPVIVNAEVMMLNPNLLLAGTVDIDARIDHAQAVIEIKTGEPTPWHALQLAPYAYLLDGAKWMSRQRLGLYLNLRGGFRLKEYDGVTDLDYFMRAFELLHWRVLHGSYDKPYGRDRRDRGGDSIVLDDAGDWRNGLDGNTSEW